MSSREIWIFSAVICVGMLAALFSLIPSFASHYQGADTVSTADTVADAAGSGAAAAVSSVPREEELSDGAEEGDDESDEDPWYVESEPFVPEMVDVIGMEVGEAAAAVREVHFSTTVVREDITGAERSQVYPWDWMVCSQSISPGELLDNDSVVVLEYSKVSEDCDPDATMTTL